MRVRDDEITRMIKEAEAKCDFTLCVCLLELKQFRMEKKFRAILSHGGSVEEHIKSKINI